MKHLILIGDGMADEPLEVLGGKTPLQYARTPHLDDLVKRGINGLLKTVPEGFVPGSEVANLSILGYNLPAVYEGRAVLEAAGMGIDLCPGDLALRCQLVSLDGDVLADPAAGHLSTAEAAELIQTLNRHFGTDRIRFHTGMLYRHLLVVAGGDKRLACSLPHDCLGASFSRSRIHPLLPEASETAALLNRISLEARDILSAHPVNLQRKQAGKLPANALWFWSPGYRPSMPTLQEKYGIRQGSVITAVDLIRGIGLYAGLRRILVEGATGQADTHYEGKAEAALKALQTDDFVYLHVEACDEAGHEGNVALKVKTIEDFDHRLVAPILQALEQWDEPVSVAILPDHPTPCALRTHTAEPVPFSLYVPGNEPDEVKAFDEFSARAGKLGVLEGDQFIRRVVWGE